MNKFESSEDYLERILMLSKKTGSVRAIDIAMDMDFSRASVSVAMKKLKENGYISVNEVTQAITLTPSGDIIAKEIYERHTVLSNCLMMLGVSKEQALEDACKIEHVISKESFEALKKHMEVHNDNLK